MSTTLARRNGTKIQSLLANEHGTADLYRTRRIGTASGTFYDDVFIGRVRYLPHGPYEFQVIDPTSPFDPHTGYVYQRDGSWQAMADNEGDGFRWRGRYDTVTDAVHALIGRPL